MRFEVPWRKIATGGVVLLLHLLLVLVLLTTTGVLPIRNLGAPREILLSLSPPPRAKEQAVPEPIIQERVPVPALPLPLNAPRAITAPPPQTPPTKEQPQGDIYGFGRYLFNCSGAYYEQLSPAEKEHCLRNHWKGEPPEREPVLGPAKPSPFDEVIKERNAPVVPIEKQCPPDAPQSNLGLPCYDFSGHHLLETVPGQ